MKFGYTVEAPRPTPERRREALDWQAHLEDLLIRSGGVTGGR
ncbi:MAG: hypothetical protein WEE64_05445 [Dehalococcoidia bacterium]